MPSEVQVILCCVPMVQVSVPLGVNMVMPPICMVQVEVDAVLRPTLFRAAMLQVWSPAEIVLATALVSPLDISSLLREPSTYSWYLAKPLSASDEADQVNVGVLLVVQELDAGLCKSNATGPVLSMPIVQVDVEFVSRPALLIAFMYQVRYPPLMVLAAVEVEELGILSLFKEPSTYNWYLAMPL